MALSRLFKGNDKPGGDSAQGGAERQTRAGGGLSVILAQGLTLQPERVQQLKEGLEKGKEFFDLFNESRLGLAFGSFDEAMKKALYEVLFLAHCNDPSFENLEYTAVRLERKGGFVREHESPATAHLYVEGAPHGVEGIGEVSPIFQEDFAAHIRAVFNMEISPTSTFGYCPIKSIHSLGSIGTVGHKSRTSDLDLQVQYELEPFLLDWGDWQDTTFRDAIDVETRHRMNRLRAQQKLPPEALKDPKQKAALQKAAVGQMAKRYPNLYRYLVSKQGDYTQELVGERGHARRTQTLHEIIQLMKSNLKLVNGEAAKKLEGLLHERLKRIQDYIASKYPSAEIYLFTCSNDDYRQGHHGSTLVSKEASGSAYELILNYETLMPGIQITPMIPTHFVLPQLINDDPAFYDRIIDYIRFGLLDVYDGVRTRLVNLGATPDMKQEYVAKHSGAVYWEAFKASSGNLPKAILNLFRIEMLLEPRFLKTIVQMIKEPDFMHQYATPKPEDDAGELQKMVDGINGLPPWAIIDMEEGFPLLKQDPWWLRYKALKIAFHEPNGVPGVEHVERARISKVMDMAFALHVRISDVFTKPGDTRPFDTNRERVLIEFLKRGFPAVSPRRRFLEHMFVGEVHAVHQFENEMRDLFKRSLNRVNQRIGGMNAQGESNQKEFEIWYHYYQENFEPKRNVVPRTILKHLTVPRTRIQIAHEIKGGWTFSSIQRQSKIGSRFDTFGHLDHLPEEVILREGAGFTSGIAESVLNGYYGIMYEGTLKETRTEIEFDAKKMDLGNRIDNTLAFLRPDNVHRVLNHIIEFFPYRSYHYMDCINLKREVTEVIIFLNLFKFGRLSFLYRDNLQTWYCDDVEHMDVAKQAQKYHHSFKALVMAKPLHITIAKFLRAKGVNLEKASLLTWINPNSVATNHSAQQFQQKEKELGHLFKQVIYQIHRPKPPASAEGEEGGGAGAGETRAAAVPATDSPPAGDTA